MSAVAFDRWRAGYATTTTEEHARFYAEIFRRGHCSFSGRAIRAFLRQAGGRPVVAEIGGQDGALAKVALQSTPSIKKWINYDICPASITSPATDDPRYEGRLMTDFRWWNNVKIDGDILVMSHIIEHLSDEDAKSLIASIPQNIKGVHVQAPIALRGPTNWTGFVGCHILSMGWMELDAEFAKHGFRSITAYDGASWKRA